MDIERLFSQPAFAQLLPEQMQLLRQFAQNIQGRGAAEVARMYMNLINQLNKIKPIPTTQKNAMIDALRGFLPDGDQKKLNRFIKMLGR